MKSYAVPNSLLCSKHLRIATYETSAFLPRITAREGPALPKRTPELASRAPVLYSVLTTVFVFAAVLLGAAAAEADPANLANQATLVRFTDKANFGAPQRPQHHDEVNAALARLTAFQGRGKLKPVQGVSSLGPIPQIAIAHKL
jgi:hypothetical protein